MATYQSTATLTTPAGTVSFNATSGDTPVNNPENCAGLDMAPIRSSVDDKSQTNGGIVHPMFYGARHVTLGGVLVIRSSATVAGYLTARATLEQGMITKLASIMNADGTYAWDEGGTTRTITVRCDQPILFSSGWMKTYVFGLVAANPTIT